MEVVQICIKATLIEDNFKLSKFSLILQARIQQYVNRELPDVQAGFRKVSLPTLKKQASPRSQQIPLQNIPC